MTNPLPILTLKDGGKHFTTVAGPLTILANLNLTIGAQEKIAITGSSGSGKTTLLHILAGIDRLNEGTLHFEDQLISTWSEDQLAKWRLASVGFIFQDFRLLPRLTALENVALPLELLGGKLREINEQAFHTLEKLGLKSRVHHFPAQLSGGEQQRVAIARAFIHNPAIIFADEPTGNLDPHTSESVIHYLQEIQENAKSTLVIVTHDHTIAAIASRRLDLNQGSFR